MSRLAITVCQSSFPARSGGQTESVGTFHYMAPEIGRGEYGKEIDVYAMGIMLYEMATGTVPFEGESSQEIIMKHLTADPDLSVVPSPLKEVIARALTKNPATRTSDVRDMLRPLGWEIDERYVLVRLGHSTPPVVSSNRGASSDPPRVLPQSTQPMHAAGDPFVNVTKEKHRDQVTTLHYQEPIARFVKLGVVSINGGPA